MEHWHTARPSCESKLHIELLMRNPDADRPPPEGEGRSRTRRARTMSTVVVRVRGTGSTSTRLGEAAAHDVRSGKNRAQQAGTPQVERRVVRGVVADHEGHYTDEHRP